MRSVAQPQMPTSIFIPAAPAQPAPPHRFPPCRCQGAGSGWDRGLLRLRGAGRVPGQSPPAHLMFLWSCSSEPGPLPSSCRRWVRSCCRSPRRLRRKACASRAGSSRAPAPGRTSLRSQCHTGVAWQRGWAGAGVRSHAGHTDCPASHQHRGAAPPALGAPPIPEPPRAAGSCLRDCHTRCELRPLSLQDVCHPKIPPVFSCRLLQFAVGAYKYRRIYTRSSPALFKGPASSRTSARPGFQERA